MLDDNETPDDLWYDIDLEAIEDYECWKPETTEWADRVNWALVLETMRQVVAELAAADRLDEVNVRLSAAGRGLGTVDRQGLESLWTWPIVASPVQITNGGHRITAIREQGIRWAMGKCDAEAVGDTVDPLHAYGPPRR